MRRVIRLAQRHPRTSSASALASAAVPSSGVVSLDNAQGACAAATQLSAALDQIGLDDADTSGATVGELVRQLDDEASRYDNAQLDEETLPPWQCSRDTAQLVACAWECAQAAYDLDSEIEHTSRFTFQDDCIVSPSLKGNKKAMRAVVATPATRPKDDGQCDPVLVIAVRGSASVVDQIVDANEGPRDMSGFLDPCVTSSGSLMAHAGFAHSAQALRETTIRRIQSFATTRCRDRPHVLFTGHSAGGAVASLLFMHCVSMPSDDWNCRFSCITFGAPPSVTGPLELRHLGYPCDGTVALNFVNEFDLVCRADRPYVLSLVDLLRSRRGQPLVRTDSASQQVGVEFPVAMTWPVPRFFYHHVGPAVAFVVRMDEHGEQLHGRAVELSMEELESRLFCRLSVHRRSCYAERVRLLERGELDESGWNCRRSA